MDTLYNMPAHPFKSDPPEISKPGNKFYAFFRPRSRSRSRSKSVVTPSTSQPMLTKFEAISVTQTHSLSSRRPRLSTEHIPSTDNPPSSYVSSPTRSIVRSQSRPISCTTTATHSTIAPLPSDALRRRVNGRHDYAPRPESADDSHESHQYHGQRSDDHAHNSQQHPPRSETPSSTKRKLGLHNFFGIALTKRSSSPHRASSIASEHKASTSTLTSESSRNIASRRRSFRLGSRPNTPRNVDSSSDWKSSTSSIPIPSNPLPLSASPRRRSFGLSSPHHTPKSSTGHLPLPVAHGSQSHGRRHSVGSHQSPHDSAVALPEDQANSSKLKRSPLDFRPNKGKERQQFGDWEQSRSKTHPTPIYSATASISQSGPSVASRRHLSSPTPSDYVDPSGGVRPHVQHLPTLESMSSDETEEPPPLFAPRPMHVIPKIIHTPPTPQRPGDLDSPARPNTTPPRVDSTKVKISHGKTKGAHREQLLVSASHRHTDSITSTPSKSPSEPGPESATGRSRFTPRLFRGKDLPKTEPGSDKPYTRGVPPNSNIPPRHISNHRIKLGSFDFERPVSALNRSSSTINRSRHRLPLQHTMSSDSTLAGKSRLAAHQPLHTDTPVHSHITPNYTGETSVVSFSSSIPSKSTEKGGGSNHGQSSSWGRTSGKRMQRTSHGAFAFEHPVSLPNSPIPSSSNLPNSSMVGPSQRDRIVHGPPTPANSPWFPTFDLRPKRSRGDPSEDADTGVVRQDRKQDRKAKGKGKGRSLDLGLGLAWAPSRVREEAVIPGLFVAKENIKANGRSYGFDVTKAFEDILSASDFEAFKKYVHRYDAHIISLDGPSGLLSRVDKLLVNSGIDEHERNSLLTDFTCFVENHSV